jgi:nucleoside-diphosphate-sugar epimerase
MLGFWVTLADRRGGARVDGSGSTRVLLTGAAGRIGTAFRGHARDRYELRLSVAPSQIVEEPEPHEVVECDVSDLESCRRACEGMEVVVHLAADPSVRADFYESLLENNIKGTYNVFRAAKDAGCGRVVFASSVNAVDGYPPDTQIRPGMPVRPPNVYGASKVFGEALGRYFADQEGLSVVAVRIGAFAPGDVEEALRANKKASPKEFSPRWLSYYVSRRDLCELLVRCIETPDISFAIAHGLSNNFFKRMDIDSTRETFGYDPKDNAFDLLGIDEPEQNRK